MDFSKESGTFITVEGPEFSGKTTAVQSFYQKYKNLMSLQVTREPGGTDKGNVIRNWVTNLEGPFKTNQKLSTMGFAMDRAFHIHDVILPALKNGDLVISDRYIDSSFVLQGMIGDIKTQLGVENIMEINKLANNVSNIKNILPFKTILFDVSEETALERLKERGNSNQMDIEFMDKFTEIREAYLHLAEHYSERYIILDANGTKEETFAKFEEILSTIK